MSRNKIISHKMVIIINDCQCCVKSIPFPTFKIVAKVAAVIIIIFFQS